MTPKGSHGQGLALSQHRFCLCLVSFGLCLAPLKGSAQNDEPRSLASPDGRIQVSIRLPPADSTGRPRWSAKFRGKPLFTDCRLGLQTLDADDVVASLRLLHERDRSVDQTVRVWFGKTDQAQD